MIGRRRGGAMTLATFVAVALLVTAGSKALSQRTTSGSVALNAGPAPWPPDYASLDRRLAALRLPAQSDAAFHIHVLLRIFVDGRPVTVPAQIGIDDQRGLVAPLHTHDASGIVHVEAVRPFPFTLGDFFAIWGVRFTDSRIGGYTDRGASRVRVYVNGRRAAHPVSHVLSEHDRIIVSYGPWRSSPTVDRTPFPPGL
jgi:hypothetical protein